MTLGYSDRDFGQELLVGASTGLKLLPKVR